MQPRPQIHWRLTAPRQRADDEGQHTAIVPGKRREIPTDAVVLSMTTQLRRQHRPPLSQGKMPHRPQPLFERLEALRIFFRLVARPTLYIPFRVVPTKWVNPRKSNVPGFFPPARHRRQAWRPNVRMRVFCSDTVSPQRVKRSRIACRSQHASSEFWEQMTKSSAYRKSAASPASRGDARWMHHRSST